MTGVSKLRKDFIEIGEVIAYINLGSSNANLNDDTIFS